jgi:hypothetical protein
MDISVRESLPGCFDEFIDEQVVLFSFCAGLAKAEVEVVIK